jgi:hypothetical protein
MLLSEKERAGAVADVAQLILSSRQTVTVQRIVPGERLYGSDDESYSDIAEIPLELNETPPEELSDKIDAVASVLPNADVSGEEKIMADKAFVGLLRGAGNKDGEDMVNIGAVMEYGATIKHPCQTNYCTTISRPS